MTTPDIDAIVTISAGGGLAGSLIALRWAPGATWLMRAANIASGVALACVIVPVASERLQLTVMQAVLGAALVGMFGLNFADEVTKGIRGLDLAAAFRDWLGAISARLRGSSADRKE